MSESPARGLLSRVRAQMLALMGGPMAFATKSLLGRMTSRRLKLDPREPNYLNLGSGPDTFEGYVNIDFFRFSPVRSPGRYYGADLRYPLRMDSEVSVGIFSEHTFEHLTYANVEMLLAECWRVLRPGGRIRIIVPDLSVFIQSYLRDDRDWFAEWERLYFVESDDPERRKRRLRSRMEALSFVTQEYGHVACWDFEAIKLMLERSGFIDVEKLSYGKGRDPTLVRDLDAPDRRLVSLYVEAVRAKTPGAG